MRTEALILSAGLGLGALIVAAGAARGEPGPALPPGCEPRPAALARIQEERREGRQGIGLVGPAAGDLAVSRNVAEVFAAADGGWTILVTRPDGVSCVVGRGSGWEALGEAPPPAGEPA